MIQVLAKAFSSIEIIHTRRAVRLSDIAAELGMKKNTLCTILQTMVDLGYLAQDEGDRYILGDKLYALTRAEMEEQTLIACCLRNAEALNAAINETVVIAVERDLERVVLAGVEGRRPVTVHHTVFQQGTMYDTVTGRILLAALPPEKRAQFWALKGAPGTLWSEVTTEEQWNHALDAIALAGYSEQIKGGEIAAYAVPVISSGRVIAAIGVYLPVSRYSEAHRLEIVQGLASTSQKMAQELGVPRK